MKHPRGAPEGQPNRSVRRRDFQLPQRGGVARSYIITFLSHSCLRACSATAAVSDSLQPHELCQALRSTGVSRPEHWSGLPCPPPGDLPDPGIELRPSTLLVDSLPSEPPGKPKNTRVGSLSLLQGTFPTQESNWVSCIAGGLFTS